MADNRQSMAVEAPRARTGVSRNAYLLTILVVALIGFALGTRSNEILAAVGPFFGIKVATGSIDLSSVERTYRELRTNYDGDLDQQKLIDGASRGLVEAAGDRYTVFMDAKEAAEFEDELSGKIGGGIGAEISVRNDQPTIVRVLGGNPAEGAGLRAGDVLVAINDESSAGWTADKAADKIRGEPGTTVKLVVLRGAEEKEFTVTRQIVNNPSVDSKLEDGLGILTITRFDDLTADLARRAAEDLKSKGARGIVLDLRGNGGGTVPAAQGVASLWLDNKLIATERGVNNMTEELRSKGAAVLKDMPTVVLVNGGSASASEIVAGALQDHKAAILVGEKTFGKGSVQKVIDLGAGTKLKVTIARWYTPNNQNITKEGIAPDKTVELSAEDANAGRDPQLEAAKAHLR